MKEKERNSLGKKNFNRRSYLRGLGLTTTAGVAALAGCTGGEGDGSDGSDGSDGQTPTSNGSPDDSNKFSGQSVKVITEEGGDEYVAFWEEMGSTLESETGATLELETGGLGLGVIERISQLMQAGNPPEIAFSGNFSVGTLWAHQGLLAPVDDILETITDRIGDPPEQFLIQRDGTNRIIPTWTGVSQLWYRSDLVEEAGFSADFRPDTWDKALEFAEMADENLDMRGILFPANSTQDNTNAHFTTWLRTNNGQFVDYRDGRWVAAFDQGELRSRMVETLDYAKQLHQYSPEASGAEYSTMINAIQNESVVMNVYPGARPKNQAIANERDFAPDVDNVVGPEKRSVNTRGQNSPLTIFEGSNVDAAKAMVEILTRPENFARAHWVTSPVHNVPAYPGLFESDAFQDLLENDLSDAWSEDQLQRHLVEQKNNTVPNPMEVDPPNPYFGAITQATIIPEMVADVLINDREPDSIMDEYAERMNSVLDRQQE